VEIMTLWLGLIKILSYNVFIKLQIYWTSSAPITHSEKAYLFAKFRPHLHRRSDLNTLGMVIGVYYLVEQSSENTGHILLSDIWGSFWNLLIVPWKHQTKVGCIIWISFDLQKNIILCNILQSMRIKSQIVALLSSNNVKR
jgi:hypothetical protein